MSFCC